jgi:hypothetical protein
MLPPPRIVLQMGLLQVTRLLVKGALHSNQHATVCHAASKLLDPIYLTLPARR